MKAITPMLKPVVLVLLAAAFVAWVVLNYLGNRPVGDPHWREDGTYRAIP